ncbi:MAG: HU family DNA-binding protein [Ruminococcus sp.]|nr:HU family DNA-binding protein [Oscillospiraceae bacterium]MBR3971372.1 HU family DNA-binding protein [Ruminococcus sp.]
MNKTELVAAVAAKSGISKKDADKAVAAVLDTIVESITAGEKVALVGFGTFEQRTRNARTGCDPRTNAKIEIPASKVPAFKAGKAFKDAVNK